MSQDDLDDLQQTRELRRKLMAETMRLASRPRWAPYVEVAAIFIAALVVLKLLA